MIIAVILAAILLTGLACVLVAALVDRPQPGLSFRELEILDRVVSMRAAQLRADRWSFA